MTTVSPNGKLAKAAQMLNMGNHGNKGVKTSTSIRNRNVKRRSGVKPADTSRRVLSIIPPQVSSSTVNDNHVPAINSHKKALTGLSLPTATQEAVEHKNMTMAKQSVLAEHDDDECPQQCLLNKEEIVQRGKKICTTKTLPGTSPVIQNILARSKQYESGWSSEVDELDLANTNNLKMLHS